MVMVVKFQISLTYEDKMGLLELVLLALGLSADAFAVAISAGLSLGGANLTKSLVVGMYFGGFQAGMPLVGYLITKQFANVDFLASFSSWIAFVLLAFLGAKMLIGGLNKQKAHPDGPADEFKVGPKKMLPLAVATSIDALAVGVSFALLSVNIAPAISLIGIITFVMSVVGVWIGSFFGAKFKSKAEVFGGLILIGLGVYILF